MKDGRRHQNIILKNIEPYMTKDNLFYGHEKGNHLYIFDLKRLPTNNAAMEYEFSYDPHIRDFFYKKKVLKLFRKKNILINYPIIP